MTFRDFFFLLLIYIPLLLVWGAALADIFRREDIGGFSKTIWVVVVLALPLLGTLIYLLARPATATSREAAALDQRFGQPHSADSHAQQLEVLSSLHDRGKLTDDEYAKGKHKVLAETVPA